MSGWTSGSQRQTNIETNTDKHRQTQTNTDKHRQTQTNTDKHRQTQTNTDKHRQTNRQTQTNTDKHKLLIVPDSNFCIHTLPMSSFTSSKLHQKAKSCDIVCKYMKAKTIVS